MIVWLLAALFWDFLVYDILYFQMELHFALDIFNLNSSTTVTLVWCSQHVIAVIFWFPITASSFQERQKVGIILILFSPEGQVDKVVHIQASYQGNLYSFISSSLIHLQSYILWIIKQFVKLWQEFSLTFISV